MGNKKPNKQSDERKDQQVFGVKRVFPCPKISVCGISEML